VSQNPNPIINKARWLRGPTRIKLGLKPNVHKVNLPTSRDVRYLPGVQKWSPDRKFKRFLGSRFAS
jgi:hypothetical protein